LNSMVGLVQDLFGYHSNDSFETVVVL